MGYACKIIMLPYVVRQTQQVGIIEFQLSYCFADTARHEHIHTNEATVRFAPR